MMTPLQYANSITKSRWSLYRGGCRPSPLHSTLWRCAVTWVEHYRYLANVKRSAR